MGGVSFNIPADSEENIDLRRDGEPMPYGEIHILVFIRTGMKYGWFGCKFRY